MIAFENHPVTILYYEKIHDKRGFSYVTYTEIV